MRMPALPALRCASVWCSKTWVYAYRSGPKVRRLTLGAYPAMSLGEARAAWREAHMDVKAGRDPAPERQATGSLLFGDVFEDWLRRDQATNRTAESHRAHARKDVLPNWQHRSVGDLARRDVLDVLDHDRGSRSADHGEQGSFAP